jgi:hypothetical protein
MTSYGCTDSPTNYEYGHLVPVELGGTTNDARNVWPEPGHSPNPSGAIGSQGE